MTIHFSRCLPLLPLIFLAACSAPSPSEDLSNSDTESDSASRPASAREARSWEVQHPLPMTREVCVEVVEEVFRGSIEEHVKEQTGGRITAELPTDTTLIIEYRQLVPEGRFARTFLELEAIAHSANEDYARRVIDSVMHACSGILSDRSREQAEADE